VFIDNSIKFTPAGGEIKIGLYPHRKYLVITIEDTGILFPKRIYPKFLIGFTVRTSQGQKKPEAMGWDCP